MPPQIVSEFPTLFRQIFAAFCVLIAETYISLFFHFSASKLARLLITNTAIITNRIQREFLFNNCIQSQEFSSASKHSHQKTNFYKQISALLSSPKWRGVGGEVGVLSLRAADDTKKSNRIQREFDSNGAIATFDHEASALKNKLLQTATCCHLRGQEEACCHFAPPNSTPLPYSLP
jgi:hypothetical protein